MQWGVNGRVGAGARQHDEASAFPNNGTVGGRVTQQGTVTQGPNDPRATATRADRARPSTCRSPGATSALGLSLGAINGAFGIDVAISALEHEGKLKILSHAARDDAEQQAGRSHAGLPDSDSDRREQHGDRAVQGRRAEAAR